MKRRTFVAGGALLLLGAGVAGKRVLNPAPDLPQLLAELQRLDPSRLRSSGSWSPFKVFNHLAQSIEYSLHGYPAMKSPLFRQTAGRLAFFAFDTAGAMRHNLAEPIPGAPPIAAEGDVVAARMRLLQALAAFADWDGPLQPHFAYGVLDKSQYLQAHIMHVRNHLQDIHT